MKKKVFIGFIIITVVVLFPFLAFNLYALTLGPLSLNEPGFLNVTVENDPTNRKTYYQRHLTDYVLLEELPNFIDDYVIALEDQNFYKHKGFDLGRTIKSGMDNLIKGETVAGGSTITQQLARSIFLDNKKSYLRKVNELLYAKRIERGTNKDKILELYLNTVYFGGDIYGIERAANHYFNKSATELAKNETILLLSLLPSPNNYSPFVNLELSTNAYQKAVKDLYYRNAISAEDFFELETDYPSTDSSYSDINSSLSYLQAIDENLQKRGIKTRSSNIEVNSYLDLSLQEEIFSYLRTLNLDKKTEVAIVLMEPTTAKVRVLIGGLKDQSFNRATDTFKAIGSTVKPLLFNIALENGFTPLSSFTSTKTTFYLDNNKTYSPANAGDIYPNRKINMIEALSTSDNIYATKLALVLGSNTLTERLLNVNLDIESNITNALGSFSISLLELTSLYNALANYGYYQKPKFFSSYLADGDKHITGSTGVQLFRKKESIIMSYMLRSTYDKSLQSYATPTMLFHKPKNRWSIKTGSTASSSFVVGYNPNYTLGIYVGTDDNNEELKETGIAKTIFKHIADRVMEEKPDVFYPTTGLEGFTMINQNNSSKSFTYYR